MNFDKAKKVLAIHSGYCNDFDYNEYSDFVGNLRPYQGLEDDYFHEIMEALFYLREHFQNELIDREIVLYNPHAPEIAIVQQICLLI